MFALGVAVGGAVGLLLGWLSARPLADAAARMSEFETRLEERTQRAERLEDELSAARDEGASARREIASLREAQVSLSARAEAERAAAAEKLALLEAAEHKLREAFAA